MSKIKKENISQFQSNELYIYHLSRDVLNSLELLYFDSLTTEAISPNSIVSLTSKSLEQHNEQLMDNEQSQAISNVCQTCGSKLDGLDVKKSHYKSDFHRFNLKRKLQKVPPVSEAEFDKIIQDLDESISGSDSSSQEDDNDSYDDDKEKRNLETIFEKTDRSLNNLSIQDNEQSVHYLNTKSPFVLFKSSLLSPERCFGIYKSSFDVTELHSNPLEALKNWNSVDQSKKYSALFMIGGGHFAGAIISHNPKPVKGNINGSSGESLLEQSVNIIEHKTFHRYTTRRKQGGSQGTNDNSNGKANSAGSSLRRYNEAALEKEVRELLNSWKNYLINCESIFIRANGALNRNILVGYEGSVLKNEDKRIKSFPFTTKRATASELKKAWINLTYMNIMDLPKTNEKLKEKLLKQEQNMINSRQIAERKAEAAQELTEDEKHTIELIGFIKKSKAPALISYIKKNKLSPDFELKPSSEYATTPTLLHCATYNNIPYITQVLLNNLKANPCIKNDLGKTPFELTSNKEIKKIFQIARYNLGEVYCNWVEDAHVNLPAKSKEEFLDEEEKLKSKEENDKKLLHEKELQAYQKEIATERVAKYGTGKSLGNVMTSISNQSMLNQLSDEQKMRLMREQRARAAEARMNRKN